MVIDRAICRFELEGQARLGLISDGLLYDLSAADPQRYGSLQSWLASAAGQAAAAMGDLLAWAERLEPLGSLGSLLEGSGRVRLLKPIDAQEVWAFGVTYQMSREARMRESEEPTIYGRVYEAERPELFFKATPNRVVGSGEAVGIRGDSTWDVPEAELALLVTPALEIIGYTIGNDMSSRDIEGENPLYLPQAKIYQRCCALGPMIRLARAFDPLDLQVDCAIRRGEEVAFEGSARTNQIHRPLDEMVRYLGRCNSFPSGAFVLTGTGIVPPDDFTLAEGDVVDISITGLGTLSNPVIGLPL